MNIIAPHQWRFACKAFDSEKKISEGDVQTLLEIIRLSPSSFGFQPFQVLVIQNPDLRTELLSSVWGGQKQIPTASHLLAFMARRDVRYDAPYIAHTIDEVQQTPLDMRDFRLNLVKGHQENDAKLLEHPRLLEDWAGKQAYIALGNLMTAAAQLGIDSCPIEGFHTEKTTQTLARAGVINPENEVPVVFCALGYRIEHPSRPKMRQPMNALVKWI